MQYCTIILLHMNRLNKAASTIFVSLMGSMLPEDLHSELILLTIGNRELGTKNREAGTSNHKLRTGNRSREPATGNQEAETGNQEPGIGNLNSGTKN